MPLLPDDRLNLPASDIFRPEENERGFSVVAGQDAAFREIPRPLVFRLESSGRICFVSVECRRMLGISGEEIAGQPIYDFDSASELRQAVGKLLESGTDSLGLTHCFRKRDGREVRVETTLEVVRDDRTGMVSEILGISVPVAESRFETTSFIDLLESVPDALLVIDPEDRIVQINRETESLFGYYRDELLGRTIDLLIPPDHRNVHARQTESFRQKPYKRPMRGGANYAAIHKNGSEIPIDISLRPLQTEGGLYVVAAVRDISTLKRIRGEQRETNRRFKAIFDSTFQFIGLLNRDGTLIEANRTALDFAGSSAEKEIGKPFWKCIWWSHSKAVRDDLRRAIRRAAQGNFVRYEVDVLGQNGMLATIDFSIKPILDDAGNVALLVPEGRDITEKKKIERALEQRDAIHEAVAYAGEQLLSSSSWRDVIGTVIEHLGKASGVGRVHIWQSIYDEYNRPKIGLRYEWTAPGIEPIGERVLPSHEAEGLEHLMKGFEHNRPIYHPTGLSTPITSGQLETQDPSSVVYLPIYSGSTWWGFLGLDVCGAERIWSEVEIDAFKIAVNALGAAIRREADEDSLRASEVRFFKIFDLAPIPIVLFTYEGFYLRNLNQSFLDLTGFTREELVGRRWEDAGVRMRSLQYDRLISRLRDVGSCHGQEIPIRTKSGDVKNGVAFIEVVEIEGEKCLLAIFYDITDQKHLERELAVIAAGERRKIGYDLHEDLAQRLASIALLSGVHLQKLEDEGSGQVKAMERIAGLLADAISYSRKLSRRVTPVDMHPEGLGYALQDLTDNTGKAFRINSRFHRDPDVLVRDHIAAIHLFNIAQEAISNALRYGSPTEIGISLTAHGDRGCLRIENDGGGLSFVQEETPARVSLYSLERHADVIGAAIDVRAASGHRCVVECWFDLEKGS